MVKTVMTVTTLPVPKCTMDDGLDKLGYAGDALDSGRYTLAFLMEVMQTDPGSTHAIECVILTLAKAAEDLKIGLNAVSFEHKAFKAWEAKNAQAPGEAHP